MNTQAQYQRWWYEHLRRIAAADQEEAGEHHIVAVSNWRNL